MDEQLSEEIMSALKYAGLHAQVPRYHAVREVIYEQVELIDSILRPPAQGACVFIDKPELPDEGGVSAVWIGTKQQLFRVDLSKDGSFLTTGFHLEILRPTEITDLTVVATSWYAETPYSDSELAFEFSARGRRFKLAARSQNCAQLQKLLTIILHDTSATGASGK